MTTMYRAAPDGLAGNEDCGQMSAWFVLSALGLYPVDPVSGVWVFGSPLFTRAELAVPGGRLVIEAPGNSEAAVYVRAVRWNGKPWPRSWISHAELARGGTWCSRWTRGPIPPSAAPAMHARRSTRWAPPDRRGRTRRSRRFLRRLRQAQRAQAVGSGDQRRGACDHLGEMVDLRGEGGGIAIEEEIEERRLGCALRPQCSTRFCATLPTRRRRARRTPRSAGHSHSRCGGWN
jgi:hypothetical protein